MDSVEPRDAWGADHLTAVAEQRAAERFTSGGLAKLLDRLEQSGLIARVVDVADRRRVFVCLSDAGRERQDRAMACHVVTRLIVRGLLA